MSPNHLFTNNRDNAQSDEKLCIYFFKPLMIEIKLPIFQRTKLIALCDRSVAGIIVFASKAVKLLAAAIIVMILRERRINTCSLIRLDMSIRVLFCLHF